MNRVVSARTTVCYAVALGVLLAACFLAMPTRRAHAVVAEDWRAGRIIDDEIFTNKDSMTVEQIQQFLDSKVPVCDTYHVSSSPTNQPPFTCLKEYVENPTTGESNFGRPGVTVPGGKSSAQMIWEAAQTYTINPQTLIVILQKESSLVTDTWPWQGQYNHAMGAYCPDTDQGAACDPARAKFSIQMREAARLLRAYITYPNYFPYGTGVQNILYNPNTGCGSTPVNVLNPATAALYNYTPYQPNAAALANLYGTGDACSAYGNRNFWRIFNDWFGRTTIPDLYDWDVVKTSTDSRYFLVVGNTKRWIPTAEIYDTWKLSTRPVNVVSQAYFDSIPTIPQLDRLGYVGGKHYIIDDGKKSVIEGQELFAAWGFDGLEQSTAAPLYTLLNSFPTQAPVTRFMKATTGTTSSLLISGFKLPITTAQLANWGGSTASTTTISDGAAAAFPTFNSVPYANLVKIGATQYLLDRSTLYAVTSQKHMLDYDLVGDVYIDAPYDLLAMFPQQSQLPNLVRQDAAPEWYLVVNGKKYYVPAAHVAKAWGQDNAPVLISQSLGQSLANGGTLQGWAKDATTNEKYIFTGAKRKVSSQLTDSWSETTEQAISLPTTYLALLPSQPDVASILVKLTNTPHYYVADRGKLRNVPNSTILSDYTCSGAGAIELPSYVADFVGVSAQPLKSSYTTAPNGDVSLIQQCVTYQLAPTNFAVWGYDATESAPTQYATSLLASYFGASSQQLPVFVRDQATDLVYVAGPDGLRNIHLNTESYTQNPVSLSTASIKEIPGATSYIVQSNAASDQRIWLINQGKKTHILSASQLQSFSRGGLVPISVLPHETLEAIPTNVLPLGPSRIITAPGAGFKLINPDRSFYGFASSASVIESIGTGSATVMPTALYNSYTSYRGPVDRLIKDATTQKVYWIEGGKIRWILSPATYTAKLALSTLTVVSPDFINAYSEGPVLP